MTALKTCPVLIRYRSGELEILAFRHPETGVQLVKGTVEEGEGSDVAALRELREDAGIEARIARPLGFSSEIAPEQSWMFYLCAAGRLPDEWTHHCADGGGHEFRFFWHPMDVAPDGEWDPVYRAAMAFVREVLCGEGPAPAE